VERAPNQELLDSNAAAQLSALESASRHASAHVAAARDINAANPAGGRYSEVVGRELGLASVFLLSPDAQSLEEASARAASAVDPSVDLNETYAGAAARGEALQKEMAALRSERERLYAEQERLQSELLAKSRAEAQREKSRSALLGSLTRTLSIAGIAAALAAVVSFRFMPSLTLSLGSVAALFLGGSYFAATVTPWMVYVGGGVTVLVGGYILYRNWRETQLSTGAVGFIRYVKEKVGREAWHREFSPKAEELIGRKGSANHREVLRRLRTP